MADQSRAKRQIEIANRCRDNKSVWEQHWEDLARVMLPQRLGFTSTTAPGDKRTTDLYDGTPMQAARGLANAIGGMVRPDGEKWVYIHAVDDRAGNLDEAKDWIADTEDRLRDAIMDPHARFRQATGEVDLDLVVFGTGVLYVGESQVKNHLLFQALHLKDACPYFDEEGRAVGMYRWRSLTVRQAVQRFGLANVSDAVREKYRTDKYDDLIEYLHCVTQRGDGYAGAMTSRKLPYTDTWIDTQAKEIAHDGGFNEFPFVVPRWDTSSGEDYGRSPGMVALPDANTLQAMGETLLIAGQRAATPPMAVPYDGAFAEMNTFPDGITYYDPDIAAKVRGNPFFPLESGANMPLTVDMQRDRRDQVLRAFLRNILNLPVDGPDMTATEVIQRKEEFLREIGPTFGRLETDYTAPMVERTFRVMLRAGAFLPVPPALQGSAVRFAYESPVKRIREQMEARAAQLWFTEAANVAQVQLATGNPPEALDIVNTDEYLKFGAEAVSLPNRLVNGDQTRAAIRADRAQRQAAMQKAQALQQGIEMAHTASGAVKNLAPVLGGKQAA